MGEVAHKKRAFPGEHAPIIDQALWKKAQAQLAAKGQGRGKGHTAGGHLLTGLPYDENGNRMSPTRAVKRGKYYRYYVSQALLQHRENEAGAIKRIAALAIEAAVVQAFTTRLKGAERRAWTKMTALEQQDYMRARLVRVELRQDGLAITPKRPNADTSTDGARSETAVDAITVPIKMLPRGGARLMMARPAPANAQPDKRLTKAVVRAREWREALATGRVRSVAQIADQYGYTERYVRHMLRLAFLSPALTEAIVQGRQRPDLTLARVRAQSIPFSWVAQRRML